MNATIKKGKTVFSDNAFEEEGVINNIKPEFNWLRERGEEGSLKGLFSYSGTVKKLKEKL